MMSEHKINIISSSDKPSEILIPISSRINNRIETIENIVIKPKHTPDIIGRMLFVFEEYLSRIDDVERATKVPHSFVLKIEESGSTCEIMSDSKKTMIVDVIDDGNTEIAIVPYTSFRFIDECVNCIERDKDKWAVLTVDAAKIKETEAAKRRELLFAQQDYLEEKISHIKVLLRGKINASEK